ncbi:MAG: cyclase family protein [Lachnospiraceae bacterium]|nr:cyclase family protein [Lachnospiraceae bacterium]
MLMELSYLFAGDEPKWPTNPNDHYVWETSTRRGCANNASTITHHMHNGSHVDAPRHFTKDGLTIDQIPVENFYYEAPLTLNIPKAKGERIRKSDLEPYAEQMKKSDILLVYTGYADLRYTNPQAFIDDFPCWGADACTYIRKEFPSIKALAMDVLSVDSAVSGDAEGFPAHHALLDLNEANPERTLLIFEDINTKKLFEYGQTPKAICAFPVRFTGLEAAPVSMVAMF